MSDKVVDLGHIAEVKKFFSEAKVVSTMPVLNKKEDAAILNNVSTFGEMQKMTLAEPPGDVEEEPRPLTKLEQYVEDLRTYELTIDDAAKIVDSIVTKFAYEEVVPVTRKLRVVLKTRTSEANLYLNDLLAEIKPQHDSTYFTVIAQANLAASLVRYGDHKLDPDTKEGFAASVRFMKKIPGPLFALLLEKLNRFDEKMKVVMREGCIENF